MYEEQFTDEHQELFDEVDGSARGDVSTVRGRKVIGERPAMCRVCLKEPPLRSGKRCRVCIIKELAKHHLGTMKRWRELDALLERQNGRCAYSNLPIDFGRYASVDHKVSKCRGGEESINNLQFVHLHVNFAKNALSEGDFLRLVEHIYHHRIAPKAA